MSLEFECRDAFEIEVEIFNSKSRLMKWAFDEAEFQTDPIIIEATRQNYKELPINL